jgi:hypothetical protein
MRRIESGAYEYFGLAESEKINLKLPSEGIGDFELWNSD